MASNILVVPRLVQLSWKGSFEPWEIWSLTRGGHQSGDKLYIFFRFHLTHHMHYHYLENKKVLGFHQNTQTFQFRSVLLWRYNLAINSVFSATTNNPIIKKGIQKCRNSKNKCCISPQTRMIIIINYNHTS